MSRSTCWTLMAAIALLAWASLATAQGPEEQACQGDDGQACFTVGMRHLGNMDNAPGMQRSIPYFTKACDRGVARGCFALGAIYQTQQTTGLAPNDLVLAKSWFQKACAGGFAPGCKRVTDLENPNYTPTARRPTPEEEAGCTRGNGDNCWTVALYIAGDGAPDHIRQGATALETACNGNIGPACLILGVSYKEGSGVVQDLGRAMSLLTRGCDLAVTLACQTRDEMNGGGAVTTAAVVPSVAPPAASSTPPPAPAPVSAPAPPPSQGPEPSFEGIRMGMSPDAVRSKLGNPIGQSASSDGGEIWVYRNRTLGVTFDKQRAVVHLLAMSRDAGAFEGIRVDDKISKATDLANKRGWKVEDLGTMLIVSTPQWMLLVNGADGKISMLTWSVATGN